MAGTVNLSSAISAGLSGMNAEASAAGDVYGEAPSVSYAPETPRERQMEYLILLDEVPFYDNPSVDTTQAGTLAKGTSLLGSEMVTEDGISMLRSEDEQGEFFVAVCNERNERNLQSASTSGMSPRYAQGLRLRPVSLPALPLPAHACATVTS
jgi:hypothetical protein